MTQVREMEDKLREMEKELHDLYVQQIRDESTVSECNRDISTVDPRRDLELSPVLCNFLESFR